MDELLSTTEAARLLGLAPRTLENKRVLGEGPSFIKLGRTVRYSREDLLAWVESGRRRSTSEEELVRRRRR